MSVPMLGHRTWLEISGSAITGNIGNLLSTLEPGVTMCAVVKANAYGHGLSEVSRLVARANIATFAVDSLDEALMIRSQNPTCTIIILGMTVSSRLAEVVSSRLVQTVYDTATLADLAAAAKALGAQAFVNLKLETGLYRQGMDQRELETMINALATIGDRVAVVGVGSHLASSENLDDPETTRRQLVRFEELVAGLTNHSISPEFVHVACSAAALTRPETHYTMVRFGLAIYGLWPSASVRRAITLGRHRIDLSPALSWCSSLAQIKQVSPGTQVGYGGTFTANRPMRLAVVPVGYYDGYDRKLSNRAEVLVRGTRCKVLGNVCMNMLMVDVSNVSTASRGDRVTLIGRDGMHAVTADDLAERSGTINYEIVTRINPLLPRLIV